MKAYIIAVILICITLIGMPLTLGTSSEPKEKNQEIKPKSDYSHVEKYRVIGNKIYKIFDGGLFQNVETGEMKSIKEIETEIPFYFVSFSF